MLMAWANLSWHEQVLFWHEGIHCHQELHCSRNIELCQRLSRFCCVVQFGRQARRMLTFHADLQHSEGGACMA